ncbi:MAG: hypothetical protein GX488_07380 [Clostridiales bacterium]|nr:hypothetical protein [Clostridiales bacterium]
MEKNKKRRSDIYYRFHDICSVESASEFTGLTPSPPLSYGDDESYSEMSGAVMPNYSDTGQSDAAEKQQQA